MRCEFYERCCLPGPDAPYVLCRAIVLVCLSAREGCWIAWKVAAACHAGCKALQHADRARTGVKAVQ